MEKLRKICTDIENISLTITGLADTLNVLDDAHANSITELPRYAFYIPAKELKRASEELSTAFDKLHDLILKEHKQ